MVPTRLKALAAIAPLLLLCIFGCGGGGAGDGDTDQEPPFVRVDSPNGGEIFLVSSPVDVTWTATDNTGVTSISIAVSRDGGSSFTQVVTGEQNDGAYSWSAWAEPTPSGRVRVTAFDGQGNQASDVSDANFQAVIADETPPTVALIAPNGGEIWEGNTTQNITWTATDNVGIVSVSIGLSTNGGASFLNLTSGQENDGVYPWIVSSQPSQAARVVVSVNDFGGNVAADTSDGDFSIVEAYRAALAAGVTLEWKIEGQLLRVRLSAQTTGWVAVGFDPTDRMRDANLIIGYVGGGSPAIRDDYGSGPSSHSPDVSAGGTDDVTEKSGTEVGGATEIRFTIPLDSGDSLDRALVGGNTYTVILSHGPNGADNFTTQHTERAATMITL